MRLQEADDKLRFMRWGWIDLLASVPAGGLQAAKLFRAFQLLRVLRAIKSLRLIWRILFRNRADGIVASAAPATFLLVEFGPLTLLLLADRTSVVWGKSVSVRVDIGGSRF